VVNATMQPRDWPSTYAVVNISAIHAYYARVQSNNEWNPVAFYCDRGF
jgi:hypothetical protein